MPVSVKDYLNSMKKLSSSIDRSFKKKNDVSLDTKTQALLSQLIEAISFANSFIKSILPLVSIAKIP